jgi:uncharacterized phiE125 gp8 family phage protein
MQRTILVPATLAGAALDALKAWLAIGTTHDDTTLTHLLRASLDTFEAFTGLMALEATAEEIHPAHAGWSGLVTRPVQAIGQVEGVPAEGARVAFAADAYAIDFDADGGGRVRLMRQGVAGRIAVRFTAGLAGEWDALPEAVRHGVIRLAAHHFRARDDARAGSEPPTAVAALWRPWRRMRLA